MIDAGIWLFDELERSLIATPLEQLQMKIFGREPSKTLQNCFGFQNLNFSPMSVKTGNKPDGVVDI